MEARTSDGNGCLFESKESIFHGLVHSLDPSRVLVYGRKGRREGWHGKDENGTVSEEETIKTQTARASEHGGHCQRRLTCFSKTSKRARPKHIQTHRTWDIHLTMFFLLGMFFLAKLEKYEGESVGQI